MSGTPHKPTLPRLHTRDGAPRAWWLMDTPRGTFPGDTGDVYDLAGSTPAGVRSGGCTFGDGPHGRILAFDGATGSVALSNGGTTGPTKPPLPLTVAMSVRIDSADDAANGYALWRNDQFGLGGAYVGVQIATDGASGFEVDYGDNVSTGGNHRRSKAASAVWTVGTWLRLVVVVRGPTDMSIYVNGVDVGGTYSGTGGALAYSTAAGALGSGLSTHLPGALDDVRVYDYDLSQAGVARDLADPFWRLRKRSLVAVLAAASSLTPITGVLGAQASPASAAFVASGTLGATLGAAASAASAAFVAVNTPPAITGVLGAQAASSVVALVGSVGAPGIAGVLGAQAASATVAFVGVNTPPAITGTLGAAAGPATVAFVGSVGAPGIAGVMGAGSGPASTAFVANVVPPAITATLSASASPASLAFVGSVGAAGIAGVLGVASGPSSVAFAATVSQRATLGAASAAAGAAFTALVVPPPITATLSAVSSPAATTFGLFIPGGVDLKQAIAAALLADASLAAKCGDRVYPTALPQTATLPAVGYWFTGSEHTASLTGAAGMRSVRVRFEILTRLVSDMEALAEVIRNRFQGLIGTISGVSIAFVTLEDERDRYEEPLQGSDLGTHAKEFDLLFKLRETIPILS